MKRFALIVLLCLLNSVSVTADEFSDTKALAEQGNAEAQFNLGSMYFVGTSVPRDDVEALKWFLKSAEQGEALSMEMLALMYSMGQGVPQDDNKSIKWRLKAAEAGSSSSLTYIAGYYLEGVAGFPKDVVKAAKYYRRAADDGDAAAQYELAHLYMKGTGVPQDYLQAYVWFDLVASTNYFLANDAKMYRDDLKDDFTPEMLLEAQESAAVLKTKVEKDN